MRTIAGSNGRTDGRSYVDRLISAAQVFRHLATNCHQTEPDCEGQVRPLIGLTPDKVQLVWECAVQMAREGKELGLGAPKAAPAKDSRPKRSQQRRLITAAFGELLTLLRQKATHDALLEKAEALHAQVQAFFPVLKAKS